MAATNVRLPGILCNTVGKWVALDYLGSVTCPSGTLCQLACMQNCVHHINITIKDNCYSFLFVLIAFKSKQYSLFCLFVSKKKGIITC